VYVAHIAAKLRIPTAEASAKFSAIRRMLPGSDSAPPEPVRLEGKEGLTAASAATRQPDHSQGHRGRSKAERSVTNTFMKSTKSHHFVFFVFLFSQGS
jgi:hypothetical protein